MYGKISAFAINTAARLKVPREYIPPAFGYEQSLLEKIIETILGVIMLTLIGAFLIYFIIYIFYKGREVRIFVVRKRKNLYKTYSRRHGTGTQEHYVVYAKYQNSDKIHTLGCDGYIYQKLSAGNGYNVTVKLMWIKKVHREKLKSKKNKKFN